MGSMIDIVIFLMGIMTIYAVIGLRIIGDLEGDVNFDQVIYDFGSKCLVSEQFLRLWNHIEQYVPSSFQR